MDNYVDPKDKRFDFTLGILSKKQKKNQKKYESFLHLAVPWFIKSISIKSILIQVLEEVLWI